MQETGIKVSTKLPDRMIDISEDELALSAATTKSSKRSIRDG
jgi:hypothetical protein